MPSPHPAHVFPFSGLALDISSSCISLNLNPLSPKAHPKPHFIGSEVHARDGFPTTHIALTVEGASWSSPNYYPRLVISSSWAIGAAHSVLHCSCLFPCYLSRLVKEATPQVRSSLLHPGPLLTQCKGHDARCICW